MKRISAREEFWAKVKISILDQFLLINANNIKEIPFEISFCWNNQNIFIFLFELEDEGEN